MKNYFVTAMILFGMCASVAHAQNADESPRFIYKLALSRAAFGAKKETPECTAQVEALLGKLQAYVASHGLPAESVAVRAHIDHSVIHKGQPYPNCQAIIDYSSDLKIVYNKETKLRGEGRAESSVARRDFLLSQPDILSAFASCGDWLFDAIFRPSCQVESVQISLAK